MVYGDAVPPRCFSVREVERLIPALEAIFGRVLQLRAALRAHGEVLGRAGVRVPEGALAPGSAGGPAPVERARALYRACYEQIVEELKGVEALGGEVKDLEQGLVDFPSRRRDEEILLCWRMGEKAIEFWHTRRGGFGGRRPIDADVPRDTVLD